MNDLESQTPWSKTANVATFRSFVAFKDEHAAAIAEFYGPESSAARFEAYKGKQRAISMTAKHGPWRRQQVLQAAPALAATAATTAAEYGKAPQKSPPSIAKSETQAPGPRGAHRRRRRHRTACTPRHAAVIATRQRVVWLAGRRRNHCSLGSSWLNFSLVAQFL
ncbi:hypothetical protein BC940DRAFT_50595 [Gongronella butleri]|nr:hypothetical protein BC940DRAFT_50595 [Gongronella butleri]